MKSLSILANTLGLSVTKTQSVVSTLGKYEVHDTATEVPNGVIWSVEGESSTAPAATRTVLEPRRYTVSDGQ